MIVQGQGYVQLTAGVENKSLNKTTKKGLSETLNLGLELFDYPLGLAYIKQMFHQFNY